MHIHESGRDVPVLRIDDQRRRGARQFPHRDDPVAPNGDVRANPRIAGAIEHARVDDQDVERQLLRGWRRQQREREDG
jgi:hypothetical protein